MISTYYQSASICSHGMPTKLIGSNAHYEEDIVEYQQNAYSSIEMDNENSNVARQDVVTSALQSISGLDYSSPNTQYIEQTNINNVITENYSIINGGYLLTYASVKQYQMVDNQLENVVAKTQLKAEPLYTLSQVALQVLNIKKAAVDLIKLSVEVNQESYTAVMRSTTNVLNGIQVFFQARNEYVTAVMQQVENYLNLQLVQAEDPTLAIK